MQRALETDPGSLKQLPDELAFRASDDVANAGGAPAPSFEEVEAVRNLSNDL